jgi:nucleoside-diphosphate-sugar epimerase
VNKKILIIGGTGFFGFNICKKLLTRKYNITSLSLNSPVKKRKLKKIRYIKFDVSKNINKVLKKCNFDYVINCGGYVEHYNEKEIARGHYKTVKSLYNFLKYKKIKLFIQIGSSAEYGSCLIPHKETQNGIKLGLYGKHKLKATNFLLKKFRTENFPVTILRFYQLYGPNQDTNRFMSLLINSCIEKKKIILSNGEQKRDFLYIDDAVTAIIKTINSKKVQGEIFNIGYGKSVKLNEIINYIFKKTSFSFSRKKKIKLRTDEKMNIYPDIKKARKIIRWIPSVKLRSGIDKTIKFYKKK